jgi:hypothetical protein
MMVVAQEPFTDGAADAARASGDNGDACVSLGGHGRFASVLCSSIQTAHAVHRRTAILGLMIRARNQGAGRVRDLHATRR